MSQQNHLVEENKTGMTVTYLKTVNNFIKSLCLVKCGFKRVLYTDISPLLHLAA